MLTVCQYYLKLGLQTHILQSNKPANIQIHPNVVNKIKSNKMFKPTRIILSNTSWISHKVSTGQFTSCSGKIVLLQGQASQESWLV